MTHPSASPAPSVSDQARGYWVAATCLRRRWLPGDVADALKDRGEFDAEHARALSAQTLCVLGSEARLPRLRGRIMKEWPSLVPFAPQPEPPGAA